MRIGYVLFLILFSVAVVVIAKADFGGFGESDFYFTNETRKHKEIIIQGVNMIAKNDPRCATIEPESANISSQKGTKSNPIFYVTCGKMPAVVNVFFSADDVIKNNISSN